MQTIVVSKVSELSEANRQIIIERIRSIESDVSLAVFDLTTAIGEGKLRRLQRGGFEYRKLKNKDDLEELGHFRERLIALLRRKSIEFKISPKLDTVLALIKTKSVGTLYKDDEESYDLFFYHYGYSEKYYKLLRAHSNRITSMRKAISEFNRTRSQVAGFKIRTLSAGKIIKFLGLDKRLMTSKEGVRYCNKNDISSFFSRKEAREGLLREIRVWGWQGGWKNFSEEENKPEKSIKRGWLFVSDVRGLRDLYREKTIKKEVLLKKMGVIK